MANEPSYTPEQLKKAYEFVIYTDLIDVLTEPDQTYTKKEIKEKIDAFLAKEVD